MSRTFDNSPPAAVALTWDGAEAPRVSAKGEDQLAQEIIQLAKECNIPLYEDAGLVALLAKLELGEEIPRELYLTVARVIAFSYMMAGRTSVMPMQEA